MTNQLITSSANPLIKRIRSLDKRKYREEHGEFFVEGIRPVWQAFESGAKLETVIVADDLLKSDAARNLVGRMEASGVNVVQVSRSVFEAIADRDNPSGLAAIAKSSLRRLEALEVHINSVFVALQNVGNPGNLGTIIRTVDGVGASGVILIGDTTDPYNRIAVKASMGTVFGVSVARTQTSNQVLEWSRSNNVATVATSPRAGVDFWSANYRLPVLFFFGAEGEGLKEEEKLADLDVRIPMSGDADSLNLAVSVGVILYEAKRQRFFQEQAY